MPSRQKVGCGERGGRRWGWKQGEGVGRGMREGCTHHCGLGQMPPLSPCQAITHHPLSFHPTQAPTTSRSRKHPGHPSGWVLWPGNQHPPRSVQQVFLGGLEHHTWVRVFRLSQGTQGEGEVEGSGPEEGRGQGGCRDD